MINVKIINVNKKFNEPPDRNLVAFPIVDTVEGSTKRLTEFRLRAIEPKTCLASFPYLFETYPHISWSR